MSKHNTDSYNDNELDMDDMTEEEREGLEEDGIHADDGDETEDGEGDAGGEGDDDGEGDGKPDTKNPEEKPSEKNDDKNPAGEDGQADGDDKPGAEDKPSGDEGSETQEDFDAGTRRPLPEALPADLDDRKKAIDTAEDELTTKFDEGDLTTREYNAQLRKLNDDRRKLERLEDNFANRQQQMEERWTDTLNDFQSTHPDINPKNTVRWNAWDYFLRQASGKVMEKGLQPGRAEVEAAYQDYCKEFGITGDTKPAPKAKDKPQQKPPKERNVPPTLGRVPSAGNDMDDGKFASIARLADSDPLAYQDAIDKMSDSEFDLFSNYVPS